VVIPGCDTRGIGMMPEGNMPRRAGRRRGVGSGHKLPCHKGLRPTGPGPAPVWHRECSPHYRK